MASLALQPSKMGRLKELTNQLSSEEDYVMSFFQVCPDMLCILDHHKNIVHLNNAWKDILGYDREDFLDRPLSTIVVPTDVDATEQIIHDLEPSQVVRFYNKGKTKSGDTVPLEWNVILSEVDGNTYAAARIIPHTCIECERARQKLCPRPEA